MQAFLRSCCRAGSRGGSTFLRSRSSEVVHSDANLGLCKMGGREAHSSTRTFMLLRNFSSNVPSESNPASCYSGVPLPGFTRNTSPIRCFSTAENYEVPSGQDAASSSPAAEHPSRIKFKRLDKTARHIMNILDKEAVENVRSEREIPDIKPGYMIQMKVEVPENKRRVSTFKGIVIARRNAGLNTTFRLRRLVAGVGVEHVFHLYSPSIKEMKVMDKYKVRRAKLYYTRDRMKALKK